MRPQLVEKRRRETRISLLNYNTADWKVELDGHIDVFIESLEGVFWGWVLTDERPILHLAVRLKGFVLSKPRYPCLRRRFSRRFFTSAGTADDTPLLDGSNQWLHFIPLSALRSKLVISPYGDKEFSLY